MAESVFYDIADTPEEAANLTARSLLMIAIEQKIHENRWTQAMAARVLGVQQPRVSDLMNGKIDKFSLDALVNMLPAVGLTFSVEVARSDQRRGAQLVGIEVGQRRPSRRAPTVARGRRPAAVAASANKVAAVAKKKSTAANVTRVNPQGSFKKK
jgi:predicted XRE-type DNA-binding protein